jgi:tetratricopeptide (TPR) repeat protein
MKRPRLLRESAREDERNLTNYLLTIVTFVVTIASLVTILTSEALRRWVQAHPYPIFITLAVAVLIILLTFHYAQTMANRYQNLSRATKWRGAANEISPGAAALFMLLVFFAASPVNEDLLLQAGAVSAPTEELQRLLTDPDYLRRAARELDRISLARLDSSNGLIQLQGIARSIAKDQLSDEEPELARKLKKLAQSILAASDPGAPDRDDAEGSYRQSRQHLLASGSLWSRDRGVRQLVINQLRRLYHRGKFAEGAALGEASLTHWHEVFDFDDRQTLELTVELGTLLRRDGRWKDAMRLNRDTLRRLEARFGPSDRIYLLCARSCGTDRAFLGDYTGAFQNDVGLFPHYENTFGRRHPETLQMRNNIAISLRCLGRFKEALDWDRLTCSERASILGPEDTGTLTSHFAIARDLRMLGRIQEAHEKLSDVARTLDRKFEVSEQFQLLVGGELAVSLRRCGYHQEASAQAEEIFRRYQATFGDEHRETLRMGINLINDRRVTDRLADAKSLGERMVVCWTSIAGPDHPNTLAALANLACVLRAEGDPRASLKIDKRISAKFAELFGEGHPCTLATLTNLASDLAMIGEVHEARYIGERSLRLHTETRGRCHPGTLATAANLSLDRRANGDHARAGELHAKTLRAAERKLGHDHPESRKIAQFSRLDLDIEPMMD